MVVEGAYQFFVSGGRRAPFFRRQVRPRAVVFLRGLLALLELGSHLFEITALIAPE